MSETDDVLEPAAEPEGPRIPREKAAPIFNRFLYVDVAAMRAKQLRRGALPRLDDEDVMHEAHRAVPLKPERVAMEEVRRGLVLYEVPAVLKPGEVRGEPPPR